MRARVIRIMIALCAVAILTLAGCAGLWIEQYGFVAPDAEKIREDGCTVFIPGNAPSIAQAYDPDPSDKFYGDTPLRHEGFLVIILVPDRRELEFQDFIQYCICKSSSRTVLCFCNFNQMWT